MTVVFDSSSGSSGTGIVDICNMALMRFGHSTTIADLNEGGVAVNTLKTLYPICRDVALADANWNFATKRVALPLLASTQTNWMFAYGYPGDCITARRIVLPGARVLRSDQKVPFEVATIDGARVILTNMEEAELVYTARIEDPNMFPPQFVMMLVDLLASRAASPISGKPELARDCIQTYAMNAAIAKATNLNEGEDGPPAECEFISVRN